LIGDADDNGGRSRRSRGGKESRSQNKDRNAQMEKPHSAVGISSARARERARMLVKTTECLVKSAWWVDHGICERDRYPMMRTDPRKTVWEQLETH
jgi:hypothetical protein